MVGPSEGRGIGRWCNTRSSRCIQFLIEHDSLILPLGALQAMRLQSRLGSPATSGRARALAWDPKAANNPEDSAIVSTGVHREIEGNLLCMLN